MEPEAKAVTISLPLPMAQQFAQVMEGFLGSLYQALEADASMSPMKVQFLYLLMVRNHLLPRKLLF